MTAGSERWASATAAARRFGPAAMALAAAGLLLAGEFGLLHLSKLCAVSALLVAAAFPVFDWRRSLRQERRFSVLRGQCAELQHRLDRDPLTALMNRSAFNSALDDLPVLSENSAEVIVLFFDLDHFKDVNDTLGHKIGDHLLVQVAARAGAVLEGATAFARLGGDEFAAIVPCKEGRRPRDYGDAVVEAMSAAFMINGRTVEVAASVGVAVGDPVLDDGHELLRRADSAMYEAKRTTNGGCHVYDETLSSRQHQESLVRTEISAALEAGLFELHYQPLVDARTGELSSVEALLRSQSEVLRDVATATIVDVAEGSGQIIALTDWTLDHAMQTIRKLEDTPVAVNISPVYFRRADFVQRISDALLASGVRPELLTLEVTEGVLIADIPAARHSISRLREIGTKVYLDDFGTCYSSLNYLQHFELDGLKLDKSFLRNVGDRKKATKVIRSIIDFGHSLDMSVVVEGVESDWQVRLLQLLGCDTLQGYELGVPMRLSELLEWRAIRRDQRIQRSAGASEPFKLKAR